MLENITVCEYFIYYLLIGVSYSIVIEIQYRREDRMVEYDVNVEYWFWGDMFQMLLLGIINSVFWPKCIIDEMIGAYVASKIPDDDES